MTTAHPAVRGNRGMTALTILFTTLTALVFVAAAGVKLVFPRFAGHG